MASVTQLDTVSTCCKTLTPYPDAIHVHSFCIIPHIIPLYISIKLSPHGAHVCSFPGLLRDLEKEQRALGVDSYGLSVTTLEEVFLSVSAGAGEKMPKLDGTSGDRTGAALPAAGAMDDDNGRRLRVCLYLLLSVICAQAIVFFLHV
jgi:hypothetical protein